MSIDSPEALHNHYAHNMAIWYVCRDTAFRINIDKTKTITKRAGLNMNVQNLVLQYLLRLGVWVSSFPRIGTNQATLPWLFTS